MVSSPATDLSPADDPGALALRFEGRVWPYLRLCLVNSALTLASFGLYGPWAKVRQRRYLYSHIFLADHSFDYHASPWALLRSRVIVTAVIAGLALLPELFSFHLITSAVLAVITGLLPLGLLPWLVVQALRFQSRCVSFRHLRFGFGGRSGPLAREAFWLGILRLLVPLSLGLLQPYTAWRVRRFLIANRRYGNTPARFSASPADFLRLHRRGLLVLVAVLLVLVPLWMLMVGGFTKLLQEIFGQMSESLMAGSIPADPMHRVRLALLLLLVTLTLTLALPQVWLTYLEAGAARITWNQTSLGGLRIGCTWRWPDLLRLRLLHGLLVILSFGLLAPWARIRGLRYRLGRISVGPAMQLQSFLASDQEVVSAIGEEAADLYGLLPFDW
jgi:uncharacterized membrane protein YjgN (DUF898 family)